MRRRVVYVGLSETLWKPWAFALSIAAERPRYMPYRSDPFGVVGPGVVAVDH